MATALKPRTHEHYMACLELVDGEPCGGELIIEYDVWQETFNTGNKFCHWCERTEGEVQPGAPCTMDLYMEPLPEEQLETAEHEWVDEIDERDCWQFISVKTYCWHVPTKEQIENRMNDEAVAAMERRAEGD